MEKTYLGVEFGSTRIKAVAIDEKHNPVSSDDYTWASTYENGIWTYDLNEVWIGLKTAVRASKTGKTSQPWAFPV